MRISIVAIVALFLLGAVSSNADNATNSNVFVWEEFVCEYESQFDPSKHKRKEIEDTYSLMRMDGLDTDATAWKPSDIKTLSIEKLDAEYVKFSSKVERLGVVDVPHWKSYKALKLQELNEEYRLKRITMTAYRDPKVLLTARYSDECSVYAKVLNSNEPKNILKAWKDWHDSHKKNNADPKRLDRIFYVKYHSKDRLSYAKTELMQFGWWNCANRNRLHINRDANVDQFKRLFINNKEVDCDVP